MTISKGTRKLLVIAGVVIVVIGLVALALMQTSNNNHKKSDALKAADITDKGITYDPNSGEFISNPPGKGPDKVNLDPDTPAFYGVTKLLDYGITATQIDDLKYSVFQYIKTSHEKVKQVSINVSSISPVPHDSESESTVDTINFNFVVDNKTTYKVRMDYFDLDSIHLYISDDAGNQVYDSGAVTDQTL
jgi:hypothetical protein